MDKIKETRTREGLLYEGKEVMILQTPGQLWDTEAYVYNILKPFGQKQVKLTITVEAEVIE